MTAQQAAELSGGAKQAAEVASLLRARNPLIWIVTREEARVERLLVDACTAARYELRMWDCTSGILEFGAAFSAYPQSADPLDVLEAIRKSSERRAWVLRDLPAHFPQNPYLVRALRSTVRLIVEAPTTSARSIIIISPVAEVPAELSGHAIVIEWPIPDRAEMGAILDVTIRSLPAELQERAAPNGTREAAIDAAVGLTEEEAQSCYARSLVGTRTIDPLAVAREKRRVISRERVLEWIEPLAGGLDAVGGLDSLKAWLLTRKSAFSARARAYGLPAPKGALLVGVPGCGKSETAKAIAEAWRMPLLKLDMGALKSKFVGDSEANIRKALRVAETVAPCVLWLDEIEKSLAGATGGAADGGVSADALGTILSWMQDRAGSVFVVATANDVSALPPELLRKGRFDEVWFVDLPTRNERIAILGVSLRRAGRELGIGELGVIADATEGFTGAELGALVPDALYAAFADSERDIIGADLLTAARATVPLSRTAAERIAALRAWAETRARKASAPVEASSIGAGSRALDLS